MKQAQQVTWQLPSPAEGKVEMVQFCRVGCENIHENSDCSTSETGSVSQQPVASSVGATYITLKWKTGNSSESLYVIQWRYTEIPGDWSSTEPVGGSRYNVTGLHPYTEYVFRVGWLGSPSFCTLSLDSRPYRTAAAGVPSSAPEVSSLDSPSPSSVFVRWMPPLFPGGPVTGYLLQLRNDKESFYREVSGQRQNYTFHFTKPATTYRFSVAARNREGLGPAALSNITTVAQPEQSLHPTLWLSQHSVMYRSEPGNLEDVACVKADWITHNITGISADLHRDELFISDSVGIWGVSPENLDNPHLIHQSPQDPISDISIDWLYRNLYFVVNQQIMLCDLTDCSAKVVTILPQPSFKIIADPLNGYLFIGLPDGIYCMDLPLQGTLSPEVNLLKPVVKDTTLLAFQTDPAFKRLLYLNGTRGVIHSVFLDGTGLVTEPKLMNIESSAVMAIAYGAGALTVTDGRKVFTEELHESGSTLIEVSVDLCDGSQDSDFDTLFLWDLVTQPIPAPQHQPRDLQVLLGSGSAALQWGTPMRGSKVGPSAWEQWQYDVQVGGDDGSSRVFTGINSTCLSVEDLKSSGLHSFRVRARSPGGEGPWTALFKGTTLHSGVTPHFLAGGINGTWKIHLDRFVHEMILPPVQNAVDFDWINGSLYWVNASGVTHVTRMHGSDSKTVVLHGVQEVAALAVDWIGNTLYWADRKTNWVWRSSVVGSLTESVAVAAGRVIDLQLDPLAGFVYWITAHTVEGAYLNGDHPNVLLELPSFSGKQIMGLSVDFDHRVFYWVTQDSTTFEIYQADLLLTGQSSSMKPVKIFSSASMRISRPALQYCSGRLVWINQEGSLQLLEVGLKQGLVVSPAVRVSAFTVVQQKPLPAGSSTPPEVIPTPVPESSFQINGNISELCVSWEKSGNVNHGNVSYLFESRTLNVFKELSVPFYCLRGLTPFLEFDVIVKPYTYWGSAAKTAAFLRTPEAAPSAPVSARVFVSQWPRFPANIADTEVEFRWGPPSLPNGVIRGYSLYYSTGNCSQGGLDIQQASAQTLPASSTSFSIKHTGANLQWHYCFQVSAFTSAGFGERTGVVMASAESAPAPYLLVVRDGRAHLLDVDTEQAVMTLPVSAVIDLGYVVQSRQLFYLTENSIVSTGLDGGNKTQLTDRSLPGVPRALAVDWMGRRLYVLSGDPDTTGSTVYLLDLEQQDKKLHKLLHISQEICSFSVYPKKSLLLWTQGCSGNSSVQAYSLVDGTIRTLLGPGSDSTAPSCTCPMAGALLSGGLTVDTAGSGDSTLFFTTWDWSVWGADITGCRCWKALNFTGAEGVRTPTLAADSVALYWVNEVSSQVVIHRADKTSGRLLSELYQLKPVSVRMYDGTAQVYPGPECLVPLPYRNVVQILNRTDSSLTLHIPPVEFPAHCRHVSKPTLTYIIHCAELQDSESNATCVRGLQCFKQEVQSNKIEIEGLHPYTRYLLQISVRSWYADLSQHLGPPFVNWTDFGVPSAPVRVEATVLSDSKVLVSWLQPQEPNGPPEELRYQVEVNGDTCWPKAPVRIEQTGEAALSLELDSLHSGTAYTFKVLSFPPGGESFSRSKGVVVSTFSRPRPPGLVAVRNTTAEIVWQPPENSPLHTYYFQISEDPGNEEWGAAVSNCSAGVNVSCVIEELRPSRLYALRTCAVYSTNVSSTSSQSLFQTAAGIPSQSDTPDVILEVVYWAEAEDHGSNITHYVLEARNVVNASSGLGSSSSSEWMVVFQGPCNSSSLLCSWRNHQLRGSFQFRVLAVNSIGRGPVSKPSKEFTMKPYEPHDSLVMIVLGPVCAVVVFALLCISLAIFGLNRKRTNKKGDIATLHVNYNPDLELAQIRGMNTAVIQTNVWYTSSFLPSQLELELLPVFPREKLTLRSFLGSGAFGEVFEGLATDILGPGSGEVKVAVKTLRKGASDLEKSEFLKEAHLMSHFDHPHVIKLMGVCLQNEPQYLLLELMEGRDLLTFLRGARGTQLQDPLLSVADLIDICLDVAKGCTYLEKMHYVHRDLAARNCLVSVKEYSCPSRKVKIGDFGLARDIYKSDYYRKEGEGLLPVRWMAPESLIDGVFTNFSDVWSFGILIWEIMTLGQQPYPARTNLEVLHFVRTGGRLERPSGCPDDIHQLMLKCWTRDPHKRPSFRYIDNCLEHLKRSCSGRRDVVGYYNDGYRDNDTSRGIVNQAFEENENEEEIPEETLSVGAVLTMVGDDLHYVTYQPSDPGCQSTGISSSVHDGDDPGETHQMDHKPYTAAPGKRNNSVHTMAQSSTRSFSKSASKLPSHRASPALSAEASPGVVYTTVDWRETRADEGVISRC
ncbi:proto-oncogene tyrosine-protein kinase ROS-like [Polyodon spathula]|uniref:proto-oncogene tyrosine-protein kinase ROS-like n=1 Tax=Polyodon spathula TaxID=7913 RepID=UPI001B7F0413|nr:proto-oncogene tyrosine-protein kinase ROS-like [Polyodon spathula]